MKILSMFSKSGKRQLRRNKSYSQSRRVLVESLERRYCFDGTMLDEGTVTGPFIAPDYTDGVGIDLAANDYLDNESAIDRSDIKLEIVIGPTKGTLFTDNSRNNGAITYVPFPGVGGAGGESDSFTYRIRETGTETATESTEEIWSAVATATIFVDPDPVANDFFQSTEYDSAAIIDIVSNTSDVYWFVDPESVQIEQLPTLGTVTVLGEGLVSYQYTGAPLQIDEVTSDSFTYKVADENGDFSNVATVFLNITGNLSQIIDNGLIQLGVNKEGHLNVSQGSETSDAGTGPTGLRYMPTNFDSTSPGCLCEGWGVADGAVPVEGIPLTGYANISSDGGVRGMQFVSFETTPYSAVSVVDVVGVTDGGVEEGGATSFLLSETQRIRVTHDYHPTALTPNLYEVTVTIENLTGRDITDLRYRRVMDWDIEPTAFSEFVTIQGFGAQNPNLLFTSNNGFASANPLSGPGFISGEVRGNFTDSGPNDHGALFDFGNFGVLEPGGKTSFNIYYGAAENQSQALAAIAAVNARVYSIAKSSSDVASGTPNTFIFAFGNLRTNVENNIPPVANDDQLNTKFDTPVNLHASALLANDNDPDGDTVSLRIESVDEESVNGGVVTVNPQTFQISYAPPAGFRGIDSFTYRISDGLASDDAIVYVNVGAPTVTKVFALYGGAAGAPPVRSFEITPSTRVLPWEVKAVEVQFDSNVSGADILDINGASFSSASNSATNSLRWTFTTPIFVGALSLSLRSGPNGVLGADGLNLDGNGDGVGGDPFAFSFRVLEGDFDGNGIVENLDVTRVLLSRGTANLFADIDGDGDVDNNDVARARSRLRNRLPS